MTPNQERHALRWGLTLLTVVSAAGMIAFSVHLSAQGWLQISLKLQAAVTFGWALVVISAGLSIYGWLAGAEGLIERLKILVRGISRLRWLLLPLMVGFAALFPYLVLGPPGDLIPPAWTRHSLFLWLAIGLTLMMVAFWRRPWLEMAAASALGMAVVYHLATYFPHVTDYPFSLWWSETTRYYMASQFFDHKIYGQDLPWVFRDLTRYLIQSVPFLIPDSPLWLHRLWQASLRFSTTYIAGLMLARRMAIKPKLMFAFFAAWAGLYFFQGPVFYNLILIVIFTFWLVRPRHFWRTLLIVGAVSIYAGFSRINWVPMAGLIAAVFYLLEVPVEGKTFKQVVRYLLPPFIWVAAGLALGFGAQQFWVANSGNPEEILYSSFTSYLLWYRLLPNPSFAIGILPYTLLVSSPLLATLGVGYFANRKRWHFIRLLGLAGIAGALFAGGMLVSVKIGGGTNLHNLDVFLVVLLIMAVELYFGRVNDEDGQPVNVRLPLWLKAAAFIGPILFAVSFSGRAIQPVDDLTAAQDLAKLQAYADQAVAEGGEALFVSNRHLLTFGLIENVPLVHAHEKLLLQEMAMSKNEVYLESFGAEMAGQRYAIIVTDRMPTVWKDPQTTSLAAENNVVMQDITSLIQCAYQVEERLLDGKLEIYTPKPEVSCPPGQK